MSPGRRPRGPSSQLLKRISGIFAQVGARGIRLINIIIYYYIVVCRYVCIYIRPKTIKSEKKRFRAPVAAADKSRWVRAPGKGATGRTREKGRTFFSFRFSFFFSSSDRCRVPIFILRVVTSVVYDDIMI